MIKPLVSICCQTYNHEKFIAQCLDGFVIQKANFAFEILVHEDASTDNTALIVKEYEAKHPHLFRCVYQIENQFKKQNTLINILFPMARGKYIALCEGDDYWTDPFKLQKQVDFLEANPSIAGCFHDVKTVDEFGITIKENYFESPQKIYNQYDSVTKYGGAYATCALLFRSLVLNDWPDWFPRSCSDYAIDILITEYGNIAHVKGNMGAYRIHKGGAWQGNKSHKNLEENVKRYRTLLSVPKFIRNYGNFFRSNISKQSLAISLAYRQENSWTKQMEYAFYYFRYADKKSVSSVKFLVLALIFPIRKILGALKNSK